MEHTALLLIDIQQGFNDLEYWGKERNNPQAEENCAKILAWFRDNYLPIFHVRHSSTNPKSPLHITKEGFEFKPEVFPESGEFVITKNVNSAFIGTDLKSKLHKLSIKTVIIAGFVTEHCISTTARMAANLGFKTIVISDATASFSKVGLNGETYSAEIIHNVSLATLKDEFAQILTTDEIISYLENHS